MHKAEKPTQPVMAAIFHLDLSQVEKPSLNTFFRHLLVPYKLKINYLKINDALH